MDDLPISKAFTLIEPGPVVLVTTNDGCHWRRRIRYERRFDVPNQLLQFAC